MSPELTALVIRPIAARAESATTDVHAAPPTWDVRITRLIDAAREQDLLERLVECGGPDVLLASPALTRSAPAVSIPWFGSLRVTRASIDVRQGRTSASGYVEVMSVGAGTTEVRICLRSHGRWSVLCGRRRLEQLAHAVGDELLS